MKTILAILVGLAVLAAMTLSAPAAAGEQTADKTAGKPGCDAVPKCWKVVENGKEVVKCDTTRICGKPHTPQAVYVLPRATPATPGSDLSESFIPKIIKSVKEDPF